MAKRGNVKVKGPDGVTIDLSDMVGAAPNN